MNCGYCKKLLSDKETENYDPYAYHFMCTEHYELREIIQLDVHKKNIGLITIDNYPDYLKKCCICDAELNTLEINNIEESDMLATCSEHNDVRRFQQVELALIWFEFKKLNPEAHPDNDDWRKEFSQYRIKNKK